MTEADITTDVLIIGTGPAGGSMAALLSSYGIPNMLVNRYRWLAPTPRAHITNQRTMEVLRDLGPEIETEAYRDATPKELMGENVFCTSLAGEELGRIKSWGTAPESAAAHERASPTLMNDFPQTLMEPLLFKTACARGTEARMSTEYQSHVQDSDGVTTTLLDRLSGKTVTVRSRYLVGADGGNSRVANTEDLQFEGTMGKAGSINLLFKADLTRFVAHRPSVLYWILQPGSDVGGIGMGVVRMIKPWTEWLAIWGYDIEHGPPDLDDPAAKSIIRALVGDEDLPIEIKSISTWTVNDMYATILSRGRVFCVGDAIHRHPPSNGLGSNTSIQDSFNLAWKMAHVLKGSAAPELLDTYQSERAPIAKQIVTRANQSINDYGSIFGALGLLETTDPETMKANMDGRCAATPSAERQRADVRKAIAHKRYEYDTHGVEMNQRYQSAAVKCDGTSPPAFDRDPELFFQPTTHPGARLPHSWLFDEQGRRVSTLDLCGHGRFTILTGIGGKAWIDAARQIGPALKIGIETHLVGPRSQWRDYSGDWADLNEITDAGIILVRPDHHIAWRSKTMLADPVARLREAVEQVLSIRPARQDRFETAKEAAE